MRRDSIGRTLRAWRRLVATIFLAVLLSSCGEKGPRPVAWIDGQPLAEDEFRSALVFFGREIGPRDIDNREKLEAAVDDIASASLLAKEAIARSMHQDPAFLTELAFFKDAELRRALREDILTRHPVADADIRSYYGEHEDEYRVATRVRMRHIFFDTTGMKTDAERARVRRRAEAAWKDITSGSREFADVAAAESNIGAASAGEILGPVFLHTLAPEIQEALKGLRPGEVSGVIETPHGYEILQLEEWDEAHVQPFEKSREGIRSSLEEEQLESVYGDIIREYREKKPFETHTELLEDANVAPDAVVADNGEITITLGQYRHWSAAARMAPGWGKEGMTPEKMLNLMIEGEILRREALRREFQGTPEFQWRARWFAIKRLADQYVREEAARRVGEPTDQELLNHYQQYPTAFATKEETELRAIYIEKKPEDPNSVASRGMARREALREALEVRERAVAGEPFEDLARRYSSSPEAENGGLLPYSPNGPRGYVIDTTADTLEVGEISEPVEFRNGYVIIKKTGERAAEVKPFDEIRDRVRKHYMAMKAREKEKEIRGEVLENAEVRINEAAVKEILGEKGA